MGKKKKRSNKRVNRSNKTNRSKGRNRDLKTKSNRTKKRVKNTSENSLISKKDVKMKFKYKHPKIALTLKIFLIIFIILFVVGAGVIGGLIFGLWGDDLNIDVTELVLAENSIIVDSDGNIIAELSGDENRKIVTLEEMSPYLTKAYIAIEDERYETHHGVDIKGTGRAILSFVTNGGKSTAGGGSTITQQLVKNITQEKDSRGLAGVTRKLKEWVRAYQVEEVMSKDQILELYLNLIFVGGNQDNRGVEIASQYYFNKASKDLSIAQCAFLAGINHSPNRYNPYNGKEVTEKITKRTKTVLGQMKKLGYVTQEEYDTAVSEVEAGFQFQNGAKGNIYSAHTDALITQLIEQIMEEKQISQNAAKTYLYSSGLKIYSTQVTSIQNIMQEEVKKDKYVITSKKTGATTQAGMAVIQPSTGYVVGCVGQLGEKTTSRGLNRALSVRQTGSAIKPIADVLPAIEEGLITPATIYLDKYTVFGGGYDPENYNGFKGKRNVRTSLTTSQNIPFLKIMAELTPAKSMEYLKKMGVTTLDDERDNNLALSIGGLTWGISPLEMAATYAMVANDGTYIEPTFYSKVEDSEGKVVLEPGQRVERVCSVETAYLIKDMLTSVVEGAQGVAGTATYCKIKGMDVAAKTGSTNDYKDRWLCGFTNYYAGATWLGYDEPERVEASGNPAGQIFAGVMKEIHKDLEGVRFTKPENVVTATVCSDSGLLASSKCTNKYSEIFIKGKLPKTCDAHKGQFTICSESGKLANEYCKKTEVKSTGYVYEKEKLGLWNTPSVKELTQTAPKETCTIHKKVELVVKPEQPKQPEKEPEKQPEKEPEKKPEENKQEQKPNQNTETKPGETTTKPSTGTTNNQGENKPQDTNNNQSTSGENANNAGSTNNETTRDSQENKPQE